MNCDYEINLEYLGFSTWKSFECQLPKEHKGPHEYKVKIGERIVTIQWDNEGNTE